LIVSFDAAASGYAALGKRVSKHRLSPPPFRIGGFSPQPHGWGLFFAYFKFSVLFSGSPSFTVQPKQILECEQ
jgi:hypothetical protein